MHALIMPYHVPALCGQSVDGLAIRPDGFYVDATFGGGGHSRAILDVLGPAGRLIAFDRDPDSAANAPADDRLTLLHAPFSELANQTARLGIDRIDGLLADLGVSFHQFDTAERGFSIRFDGPLDMRMDPSSGVSAAEIVNKAPVEQLASLFRRFGELPRPRAAAEAIVRARAGAPVLTTSRLLEVVAPVFPARDRAGLSAQLFQALRIEVNDELGELRALLTQATALVRPGGRCAIISYHSLEDRLVKRFLAAGNETGEAPRDLYGYSLAPWKPLTRKPVQPDDSEVAANPRARSARLRVAERTDWPIIPPQHARP